MQRVVRLSLAGLLAFAGAAVTACGDKVTLPIPAAVDSSIHAVTVAPPAASVAVGSTTQLAASVNAGPGATVRTVTWSSSDATIASVDQTGKVTGVKGGSATIIAKSNADASVSGAASITVTGGGIPTVTISSVNNTICVVAGGCSSTPIDVTNAKGQLDIVLNVEANGTALKSVSATVTCGTQTLSASQTVSNLAPVAAEASSVPVNLSINTAQFNATTGAVSLNNGSCSVTGTATPVTGAPQNAANSVTFTLNNTDALIGNITTTKPAVAGGTGLSWVGGDVTVSALPIFYTKGRSAASVSFTLSGTVPATGLAPVTAPGTITVTTPAANAATTATFPNSGTTNTVAGLTLNPMTVSVSIIDNSGNAFAPGFSNTLPVLRLDNQAPAPGGFNFFVQNASHHWVGKAFVFNTTAGNGYSASVANAGNPAGAQDNDQGGVDKVGVVFQFTTSPATTASVWTPVTAASAIPASTDTTAYTLRMIETDALGNAKTTTLSIFGSDQGAPISSFTGGAASNATSNTTAAALSGGANFVIAFTDSASGFSTKPVLTTIVRNFGLSATAADCVVGLWSTVTKVCSTDSTSGTIGVDGTGYTSTTSGVSGGNGYYTITSTVVDQAGNKGTTLTRSVLVDNAVPVAAGGVGIPPTITGGTSVSFTGPFTDNLDLISASGSLVYPTAGLTLALPGSLDTPGTAFDNTLTKSANATVQIANFISDMQITTAGAPPAAAGAQQAPSNVAIQVLDAAGNTNVAAPVALPSANVVNGTGAAQFTTANFATFQVSNAATNISNCPTSGCTANAPAANPTTVNLTATATGLVSQTANPFSQVCFYYQNPTTTFWVLIGCQAAPAVTDVTTTRTWTYTLFAWDPPTSLPVGPVNVIVIGQNTKGNGIATQTNANITLTNP